MAYWILQTNPDRYRIFAALADGGKTDTWTVVRHRNEIAPGDEFAVWVSGQNGGVYAFGVVTERVERRPGGQDIYWRDPARGNRPTWRIGIRIQDIPDSPILRKQLVRDRNFANALILRMPGGGNPFPLTEAEWKAMLSHRAQRT